MNSSISCFKCNVLHHSYIIWHYIYTIFHWVFSFCCLCEAYVTSHSLLFKSAAAVLIFQTCKMYRIMCFSRVTNFYVPCSIGILFTEVFLCYCLSKNCCLLIIPFDLLLGWFCLFVCLNVQFVVSLQLTNYLILHACPLSLILKHLINNSDVNSLFSALACMMPTLLICVPFNTSFFLGYCLEQKEEVEKLHKCGNVIFPIFCQVIAERWGGGRVERKQKKTQLFQIYSREIHSYLICILNVIFHL